MEATSQVGKDAREAIVDNLNSTLIGIDVGLNQKRVWSNAHETFVYKVNDETDCMSLKEVWSYTKKFHSGWKDLIGCAKEGMGLVCITIKTNVTCIWW